ncbi:MAG TPA: transporter substrate-binding domain-containing protein [Pyrinomonadaceae bacterium]|nr:transporter substrate-binding domain-containing protein [Pyrinomonadaceae bacterium]
MRSLWLSLIVLCLLIPCACKRKPPALNAIDTIDRRTNLEIKPPISRDLAQIRERKTLVVLAPYNSTTYFIYQGEPLGYEYELLSAFAKDLGVNLKMIVVADPQSLYPLLNSGDGDIAAGRLIPPVGPTAEHEDQTPVAFTRALYHTEPVLVQQDEPPSEAGEGAEKALAPGPAAPLPEIDIQARLVTRAAQLAGRTVNLPEKSAYRRTLVELSDEISGDIHVVEMGEKIQDETLAQKVARGEVQFTVMQKNLADLKEAEFKNLKVQPIVGQTHRVAWAVRKNSPALTDELNRWIEEKKNGPLFNTLYKKYFVDRQRYLERVQSEYLTSTTGKLSEFDPVIKQYAGELGWDWRLLASQAFQESRFKPAARSWAGATGLLQLMPATAREFGVTNALDPADNVQGAVKFLKWLQRYWEKRIPNESERLKFVLASYNTGAGHVEDAQRLTEKYGGNPQVWEDVSYWLLQKSTQQYSSDAVVRFGFCRGLEPVNYVTNILERFDHYKQFVLEEKVASRGQRSEIRDQRSEIRGRRSEAEVRGRFYFELGWNIRGEFATGSAGVPPAMSA